jgi:hypothetical protein
VQVSALERRQRESKVCAAGDGREFALQQPLPWRDLRHHRVFSRCPSWRLQLRAIVSSAWDIRRARSVFPRHNHLDPPRPDSQIARSPNSPTFSHHFRSDATFDDTMRNGLFGLTQQSWSFVKDIQPGMPLFLYNLTERRFHGVFEAVRAERPQRDPPTLDLAAQQA